MSLDAKGRLSVPALYRPGFADARPADFVVTRHPDGCLLIYPLEAWEPVQAKLMALPYSARFLQRVVLGAAQKVRLDRAFRLLIPHDLRALAGIGREAVLIGLGTHFELWDSQHYQTTQTELARQVLSDEAKGFVF